MLPAVHLKQPTAEEFRIRFLHYLRYSCGLELRQARAADHLAALELAVRESMIDRQILTSRTYDEQRPKTVHYLSMEYLLGRLMLNNLIATDLLDTAREAMQMLGLNLDTIIEEEPDPGSATVASAVSRPASSTLWRPLTTPPTATACVMTTACSARLSRTAGKSSARTPGSRADSRGRWHATTSLFR